MPSPKALPVFSISNKVCQFDKFGKGQIQLKSVGMKLNKWQCLINRITIPEGKFTSYPAYKLHKVVQPPGEHINASNSITS